MSGDLAAEGDALQAVQLNQHLRRFKVLPPQSAVTMEEHEVRRMLRAVKPRKAAGPKGVPRWVLMDCANQLAGVVTRIFNLSPTQSTVLPCLKNPTIIPLPKKPHILYPILMTTGQLHGYQWS